MTHSAEKVAALREHAERIANEHLMDAEFCLVYEDEECEGMTEDEWRAIHDLITSARVVLTRPIPPTQQHDGSEEAR